jgi:type I restriction enzyme S subunit
LTSKIVEFWLRLCWGLSVPKAIKKKQEKVEKSLPDGWRWVRFCDLSHLVSGGTLSRGNALNFVGKIPWVKTLDLNCSVVREAEERISNEAFITIRGELLPIGTVIIAMYGGGGTIGKSGILGIEATTNQAICSILPNPDIFIPEFLHAWLLIIRPEWMRHSGGNRKDPN